MNHYKKNPKKDSIHEHSSQSFRMNYNSARVSNDTLTSIENYSKKRKSMNKLSITRIGSEPYFRMKQQYDQQQQKPLRGNQNTENQLGKSKSPCSREKKNKCVGNTYSSIQAKAPLKPSFLYQPQKKLLLYSKHPLKI